MYPVSSVLFGYLLFVDPKSSWDLMIVLPSASASASGHGRFLFRWPLLPPSLESSTPSSGIVLGRPQFGKSLSSLPRKRSWRTARTLRWVPDGGTKVNPAANSKKKKPRTGHFILAPPEFTKFIREGCRKNNRKKYGLLPKPPRTTCFFGHSKAISGYF